MTDRDWVEVTVNGKAVAEQAGVEIREAEVALGTDAPAQATVVLADPLLTTLSTFSLGAQIEIRLRDMRGQLRKLFVGAVTEVAVDEGHDTPCLIRVGALDPSHVLGLATSVLSTQNLAPLDVIRKLCSAAGLRLANSPSLGSQVPYLLLAASAQAVITELVTRHAHSWRYDVEAGGIAVHKVPPEPTKNGLNLSFGEHLYHLNVKQSGRAVHEAQVKGWDSSRSRTIVGTATAQRARSDLVEGGATWAGQSKVLVSGQPVLDQAEADALARSVVATAQRRSVTVRGQAVLLPDLTPNTWITVGQATVPGRRSYYVDRVVHRYTPGRERTVVTHFDGGDHPYTTPRPATSSNAGLPLRTDALVVGVVTNNNDPERLGRVRLKFPWLSDTDESNWARVATFGGGAGGGPSGARGSQFVPEVNDEVIAGFENGDLRRPVVLGTLYNQRSKAPIWKDKENKVNSRSITSRLGHVLEFGDGTQPGEKLIRLTLATETTEVRLSEERVAIKAPAGRPMEMTAGNTTVTFDKKGGILIKGTKIVIDGQEVQIKAAATLKAEAVSVQAKGTGQVKVEGAQVDINGTGMTKIAGGQVMIN